MKVLVITLLALVAVVYTRNVNIEEVIDLEDLSAYDYHNKIGIPLANKIREAEARDAASRITGGSAAVLGQIPYQVGLQITINLISTSVCGGVILGPTRVITAAHCWFDGRNQARTFTVVIGSITLFTGGQRINTNNVVMHELWNPNLLRNDVAIAILPSSIAFSDIARAIALPSGSELNQSYSGSIATVSGFGRTGDGLSQGITSSQFLSFVELPVISNADCARSFPENVVESNICTSGANRQSVCSGDSGGPLVVTSNNRPILIGVVSYGSNWGCTRGFPVAYARVSYFASWIEARL